MTSQERMTAVLRYVELYAARLQRVDDDCEPLPGSESAVEAMEDEMDRIWYGVDLDGVNLLRWFGIAWDRLERANCLGLIPPVPWMEPGSTEVENLSLTAAFFGDGV